MASDDVEVEHPFRQDISAGELHVSTLPISHHAFWCVELGRISVEGDDEDTAVEFKNLAKIRHRVQPIRFSQASRREFGEKDRVVFANEFGASLQREGLPSFTMSILMKSIERKWFSSSSGTTA